MKKTLLISCLVILTWTCLTLFFNIYSYMNQGIIGLPNNSYGYPVPINRIVFDNVCLFVYSLNIILFIFYKSKIILHFLLAFTLIYIIWYFYQITISEAEEGSIKYFLLAKNIVLILFQYQLLFFFGVNNINFFLLFFILLFVIFTLYFIDKFGILEDSFYRKNYL